MNEATKKYLKRVRLSFPVFQENEKTFYKEFKLNVLSHVEENPDCTMDDLNDTFGEPHKIALDYFDNMEASVYFGLMRRSKYIDKAVDALLVFLFLALLIISVYYQFAINELKDAMLDNKDRVINYHYQFNSDNDLEE